MDRSHAIRSIRDAVDIVGLVGEKAKLRKSGTGYLGGPCPIHKGGSRTACISVTPDRGQWHCFGCGEGGDALDWLQKVDGLSFNEALEELAKRTGISLPEKESRGQAPGPEEQILSVLQTAQDFYVHQLTMHPTALDYLRGRGLSEGIIQAEGIGFAPPGWDTTLKAMERSGISGSQAEQAGIAARTERGSLIDFLRERIVIPIRDARGRVLAFGGRCMPGAPEGTPKYMNSRESPVFHKGETVYGLHRARGAMREKGALTVEGYFDVLALWDHGVHQAVAPMGTALTDSHLNQIGRWTKRLTLMFDGDPAGQNAAEKALAKALPAGFDVRLMTLTGGDDPDTWAQAQGPQAEAKILAAPDWATFRLEQAREGKDFRRLEDRMAAAREVAQWIAYLPESRQGEVQAMAAHELHLDPHQIRIAAHRAPQPRQERREPPRVEPMDEAIANILAIATKGDAYRSWVTGIPRSWWERRKGAGTLEAYLDAQGDTAGMTPETVSQIRAAQTQGATSAQVDPRRLQARLEKEYLTDEIRATAQQLAANAAKPEIASSLQATILDLRARLARLTRGIR